MPTVSASTAATIYDLPNYTGEIITITPGDTPFLTAIGGLAGQNNANDTIASTQFEWQTQDLGTPAQPAILEGADISTLVERSRGTVNNVAQIFQYGFGVTYTKQAASQRLSGLALGGAPGNPVADEVQYQTQLKLVEAARDINYTFLNGAYQLPTDNSTARKTRGLFAAITTNTADARGTGASVTGTASADTVTWTGHGLAVGDVVVFSALTGGAGLVINTVYYVSSVVDANTIQLSATQGGSAIDITTNMTAGTAAAGAKLTRAHVLDLVQKVYDNFGINQDAEPSLLCNSSIKRSLTRLFVTDANYREQSRTVGGANVTTVETDFGRLNILLDRAVPTHYLGFAHLGACMPMYLPIPGSGFLFVEPIAKTGAQYKYQLYGEVGLKYGSERSHALRSYVSPASGY